MLSPCRTQAMSADFPTAHWMRYLARKVAPNSDHLWDDMVQDGFELAVKYAPRHTADKGLPLYAYLRPLIVHVMRRRLHKETAASLHSKLNPVIHGKAIDAKHYFKPDDTDGIDGIADDQPTPEDVAIWREASWRVKRAIWQAAESCDGVYWLWRYAYIRQLLRGEEEATIEFCDRYQVRRGSVYFFRDRIYKAVREALDQP